MRDTALLRSAQLSKAQKKQLRGSTAEVILDDAFDSYVGDPGNKEFFKKALSDFRKDVSVLAAGPSFIRAFVNWCNSETRDSKRNFTTAQSQFKNGFVMFMVATQRTSVDYVDINTALIFEFLAWLKDFRRANGKTLATNTGRRYFGILQALVGELSETPKDLVFPNHPFPDAARDGKKTTVLDDILWRQIVQACKTEIREIRQAVQYGRAVWKLENRGPDESKRGRGRYRNPESAIWQIRRTWGKVMPSIDEIRSLNPDLAAAVQQTHGWYKIALPFHPSPRQLFPFVLLQTVYCLANTGPMLGMQRVQIECVEVMGISRIRYTINKNRSHTYFRSFALDGADEFSPDELNKFIAEWTAGIRPLAGNDSDCVYIFMTHERLLRGFKTSERSGTDSDQCFKSALKGFCKKHGLPHFTLKNIRMTGLDEVREESDDDILSVKAAGGQKSSGTIRLYYEGAAATRRRNESLAEVMVTQERWISLGGRVDPRGTPGNADIMAATPGWDCFDPFDSPIPGETKGKLCQALGRCPACPLAALNLSSGYSLARALQLRDEVRAAVNYLDGPRWRAAYEQVLLKLVEYWLPLFADEHVREAAASLSLIPLGRLE